MNDNIISPELYWNQVLDRGKVSSNESINAYIILGPDATKNAILRILFIIYECLWRKIDHMVTVTPMSTYFFLILGCFKMPINSKIHEYDIRTLYKIFFNIWVRYSVYEISIIPSLPLQIPQKCHQYDGSCCSIKDEYSKWFIFKSL